MSRVCRPSSPDAVPGRRAAWRVVMRGACCVLVVGCAPGPTAPPGSRPPEAWWLERHNRLIARAMAEPIEILFLGDSITQGWEGLGRDPFEGDGLPIWSERYAPRRAANFGMGGERTNNLVWQVQHGLLGRAEPRVVVLLIGTNDLDGCTPEVVASRVAKVVDELRRRLPNASILLLGLFPRGARPDPAADRMPRDARIGAVNRLLEPLGRRPGVEFLDIGHLFLGEDGELSKEIMPDFLHLGREGYRRWAEGMEPTLQRLLTVEREARATP